MMMKRPRIKVICVASTGSTPTVSRDAQRQIDHAQFEQWRKTATHLDKAADVVTETTVVYNPARHRYAIVFGEKIRINSAKEYNMYIECNIKITSH